jgi:steroid delta-isomerase-like uncharacterized protein
VAVGTDLSAAREQLVREHMESENRHEFDATLDIYDGPVEVMAYFEETRRAFPDQRNEVIALHHSDDAVLVEAMLYGTHLGPLRGLPATGRKFELQFLAAFLFDGDRLVCERVYFDAGTVLRQLGIAHDPLSLRGRLATVFNHPLTVGQALVRRLSSRT